jgi:hypothetical protein
MPDITATLRPQSIQTFKIEEADVVFTIDLDTTRNSTLYDRPVQTLLKHLGDLILNLSESDVTVSRRSEQKLSQISVQQMIEAFGALDFSDYFDSRKTNMTSERHLFPGDKVTVQVPVCASVYVSRSVSEHIHFIIQISLFA